MYENAWTTAPLCSHVVQKWNCSHAMARQIVETDPITHKDVWVVFKTLWHSIALVGS